MDMEPLYGPVLFGIALAFLIFCIFTAFGVRVF
jgi:hypothetical protein